MAKFSNNFACQKDVSFVAKQDGELYKVTIVCMMCSQIVSLSSCGW